MLLFWLREIRAGVGFCILFLTVEREGEIDGVGYGANYKIVRGSERDRALVLPDETRRERRDEFRGCVMVIMTNSLGYICINCLATTDFFLFGREKMHGEIGLMVNE